MTLRLKQRVLPEGQGWRWSVSIQGSPRELEQVEAVRYTLDPTFNDPVQVVRNRKTSFQLESTSYGEFLIRASLLDRTGESFAELSHWLRLSESKNRPERKPRDRPQLFVCYEVADAGLIDRVRSLLGSRVHLITSEDLRPGLPINVSLGALVDGIERAGVLVPERVSPWMLQQVRLLRQRGVPLTVIMHRSHEISGALLEELKDTTPTPRMIDLSADPDGVARRAVRALTVTDLVALVPGPIGVFQPPARRYFHPDVTASLVNALTRHELDRTFGVACLESSDVGSLADRQVRLLEALAREFELYPCLERLHLVGHGAGGVDARLLLAESRVDGNGWGLVEQRVRNKLALVIGISAPQRGTWLVEDRDVKRATLGLPAFLLYQLRDPFVFFDAVLDRETLRLLSWIWNDPRAAHDVTRSLKRNGLLWDDLRPCRMTGECDGPSSSRFPQLAPKLEHAEFRSVLTMAGQTPQPSLFTKLRDSPVALSWPALRARFAGLRRTYDSGPGFRWLQRRTASVGVVSEREGEVMAKAVANIGSAVSSGRAPLIHNPAASIPVVTQSTNDGVVNTTRQLFDAENPEEVLAVVVADHLDVLGYYETERSLRELENPSFLKSGSGFRKAELDALYAVVAEAILTTRAGRDAESVEFDAVDSPRGAHYADARPPARGWVS